MTTERETEALAACPFCGATPHRGKMKAKGCQLHGEPFQYFKVWCPHGCAQHVMPSEAAAIAAWNRRTTPTPPTTPLDMLREDARAKLAKLPPRSLDWHCNDHSGSGKGAIWIRSGDDFGSWVITEISYGHEPSPEPEQRATAAAIVAAVNYLRAGGLDEASAAAAEVARLSEIVDEKNRWLRCVADDLQEAYDDWLASGCGGKDAIRLVKATSDIARAALGEQP